METNKADRKYCCFKKHPAVLLKATPFQEPLKVHPLKAKSWHNYRFFIAGLWI
jgi:hypothetical protein